jgi:phage gp36-like protein
MYCTLDDIKNNVIEVVIAQLSNDSDPTAINEDVVDSFIADATDYIDTFLRTRYTLPLQEKHKLLREVCIDIVKYKLFKRRNRLDDQLNKSMDDVNKTLLALQRGTMQLEEPPEVATGGSIKANSNTRIFTNTMLEDY